MLPKSRGGSDKVSNATLACHTCNQAKDNLTPEEWLAQLETLKKPSELDQERMKLIPDVISGKKTNASNRYCAWANATRKAEERELYKMFGTVECSSGGRTKFNRTNLGLPKDHHYDALCVGEVPADGFTDLTNGYVLEAKACGRGKRLRGTCNKCGIITTKWKERSKRKFGFQTGDMCRLVKPSGICAGTHVGRIAVRSSGSFYISIPGRRLAADVSLFTLIQPNNGYEWRTRCAIPLGH